MQKPANAFLPMAAAGLLLALGRPLFAAEGNWPQWRGPQANGVADAEANPPVKWSETSNVRWKAAIPGFGTSSPVIWGHRIFILSARPAEKPDGPPNNPAAPVEARPGRGGGRGNSFGIEKPVQPYEFLALCFDRASGKLLWQKTVCVEVPHEGHHKDHGFASASPVTDGQRVYAWFGSRGLYCYDLEGRPLWQKRFGRMETRNSFGEGSSPALHGQRLFILWDHEGEDFLAALDKETGEELWRQKREEPTGWTTPFVWESQGRSEVMVNGTQRIRSYDTATGKPLWECGGMTANPIPTPVVGGGLAYFLSGYRGSSLLAIKLGRAGDLTGTDAIAWRHAKGTPYVPSPLLYQGRLYFFSGNNAMISCFDAKTGQPHYEAERLEGIFGVYASPVGAADRVYAAGRDGKTAVLKAGPTLQVLAINALEDRFDASPAAVGRELFLRGHKFLYCLAEP